jgi:uncharacterized protein (TIGR03066 family)
MHGFLDHRGRKSMRGFGRFLFIAFVCLVAAQMPASADDAGKLVGTWHEYSPSDNLVRFTADGHVTMYLRKGEIGNLHTLEGNWKLVDNAMLNVKFTAMGRSVEQSNKLSFAGDEMILTDEKGARTKHRRHNGALPARTQW